MASTLIMRPKYISGVALPYELKKILQKKFGGDTIYNKTLGEDDLIYLTGLQDAGIPGASKIIAYIEKHQSVILNEEF